MWNQQKSLLIYQHFPREKRSEFIERKITDLKKKTHGSTVIGFSTSSVLFLLSLQTLHAISIDEVRYRIQQSWGDQFKFWEPSQSRNARHEIPEKKLNAIKEKYLFLRLYEHDFETVLHTLELLSGQIDKNIRYSLLRDIVVTYSRPFSGSRGKTISNHIWKPKIPGENMINLHKELRELRNRLFAHTDLTWKNPKFVDWSKPGRKWFPMSFKGFNYDDLDLRSEEIKKLVTFMHDQIKVEITQIEENLL